MKGKYMNEAQGLLKFLKVSISLIAYLAILAAFMLTTMLGAQLAFLIKLPKLSQLIQDGHSMWLVFSTLPDVGFGLFCWSAYFIYRWVENPSRKPVTIAALHARIQNLDRRHVVAVIGIVIFFFPLALAGGIEALLGVSLTLLCAAIGVFIFRWLNSIGAPLIVTGALAALYLGFFGTLLMPNIRDQKFSCTRGFVELRSGEHTPCETITEFSDKPIWLIESGGNARLMPDLDLQFEKVQEAKRALPATGDSNTQ